MDGRQVRVAKPGHGPELFLEALHRLVGEKAAAEHLQGHRLVAVQEISRQKDLSHASFTQGAENAVAMVGDRTGFRQDRHSTILGFIRGRDRKSTTSLRGDQGFS